jgi:hypothetical protein
VAAVRGVGLAADLRSPDASDSGTPNRMPQIHPVWSVLLNHISICLASFGTATSHSCETGAMRADFPLYRDENGDRPRYSIRLAIEVRPAARQPLGIVFNAQRLTSSNITSCCCDQSDKKRTVATVNSPPNAAFIKFPRVWFLRMHATVELSSPDSFSDPASLHPTPALVVPMPSATGRHHPLSRATRCEVFSFDRPLEDLGFYALLVGLLVARDRRVAVLVTCRDSTRLRAPRQSGSSWSWRRVLRW